MEEYSTHLGFSWDSVIVEMAEDFSWTLLLLCDGYLFIHSFFMLRHWLILWDFLQEAMTLSIEKYFLIGKWSNKVGMPLL